MFSVTKRFIVNICSYNNTLTAGVSGQRWRWPRLLKLDSFVLFVSFFVCFNNLVSRVRVPVVFYLNMSKKGKKQDVNDDSFESFCPTVIGKYYWNDLPLSIRNKSSKILFKKALKKYYLAQYWLVCVCVFVRACLFLNEYQSYIRIKSILLKGHN